MATNDARQLLAGPESILAFTEAEGIVCTKTEKFGPGRFGICGWPALSYTTKGLNELYCDEHTQYALIAGFAPKWIEPADCCFMENCYRAGTETVKVTATATGASADLPVCAPHKEMLTLHD